MQGLTPALIRLDLLFETVSGIIALLISHYANKAYRLTEQKRLADLSTGFMVLSAGLFGRVIGTLYFFVLLGSQGATGQTQTLILVVTLAHGFMRIMAYLLFAVSTHHTVRSVPEMVLLMQVPILLDPSLEIVALIILVVVVLQSLMNYASTRSRFGLYVLVGFFLLLLSHVAAIFGEVGQGYLISQILQLLGFLALLVMLIKVGREE
ncbi:MAG: hypothetical protein ACE5H4_01725 [Candidatus Thorarchaeota archaeon]